LALRCLNVAGLLIVRGVERRGEHAMRLALGASRNARAVTFLEAARLSCVAGAGAVVLAWLALRVVRRGMVVSLPRLPEVGLDIVTLVIVAAVAAFCVIAIAIGPAWRIARVDLEPLLRGHGRTASARRLGRITNGLVVAELSVAIVLVVISAGLVSSVRALAAGGPGFDAARVREVRVSLPPSTYKTLPAVESFYQQAAGRLRRLPGVENVTVTNMCRSAH
jgi:hypothetical protein